MLASSKTAVAKAQAKVAKAQAALQKAKDGLVKAKKELADAKAKVKTPNAAARAATRAANAKSAGDVSGHLDALQTQLTQALADHPPDDEEAEAAVRELLSVIAERADGDTALAVTSDGPIGERDEDQGSA